MYAGRMMLLRKFGKDGLGLLDEFLNYIFPFMNDYINTTYNGSYKYDKRQGQQTDGICFVDDHAYYNRLRIV